MKNISAIITLLLSSGLAISQENAAKFYPAFSVTPQVTNLRNPDLDGKGKLNSGINVEGTMSKGVSDHFHFGFGISFQHATLRQMGPDSRWPVEVENGEYKPSNDDLNDYKAVYSALGIPITGKLYLGKNENRFAITGVCRFNYVVSVDHDYIYKEPGSPGAEITDADIFGVEVQKTNLQIGTGILYEFGFGKKLHRLSVGPNIEYGIKNFMKAGNLLPAQFQGGNPIYFGIQFLYYKPRL